MSVGRSVRINQASLSRTSPRSPCVQSSRAEGSWHGDIDDASVGEASRVEAPAGLVEQSETSARVVNLNAAGESGGMGWSSHSVLRQSQHREISGG